MSAFVVEKAHIDAMVAFGLQSRYGSILWWEAEKDSGYADRHELTRATVDEVGRMLLLENIASVSYRYDEPQWSGLPGHVAELETWDEAGVEAYRFEHPRRVPSAIECLSVIGCYEYQTCEHDAWRDSEARRFCQALKEWAIDNLPGMREAPWEWTAEHARGERIGRNVP